MTSVLDVGCGTGVMFELLRERRPDLDYLGIDVTAQFVAAARERFPADAARFREGSLYDLDRLPGEFDAVLCRHILEHLPDYTPAVQRMYARARRKLIVVFYLPPRPLRLRRKRDERFERGFYTHTYDLGRFMDHLLTGLVPPAAQIRIHPRQGTSDPNRSLISPLLLTLTMPLQFDVYITRAEDSNQLFDGLAACLFTSTHQSSG